MNSIHATFLLSLIILSPYLSQARLQTCKPSGRVKGEQPPPGHCIENDDSICCIEGRYYSTYKCSPEVSRSTRAVLGIRSFEEGGDGGGPSRCDGQYHSDSAPVVAMSTGWYGGGSRCLKNVTISGNGRRVDAVVVDECDSSAGCDADRDYLPPCDNDVVDASRTVWKALGLPPQEWGVLDITWTDA